MNDLRDKFESSFHELEVMIAQADNVERGIRSNEKYDRDLAEREKKVIQREEDSNKRENELDERERYLDLKTEKNIRWEDTLKRKADDSKKIVEERMILEKEKADFKLEKDRATELFNKAEEVKNQMEINEREKISSRNRIKMIELKEEKINLKLKQLQIEDVV